MEIWITRDKTDNCIWVSENGFQPKKTINISDEAIQKPQISIGDVWLEKHKIIINSHKNLQDERVIYHICYLHYQVNTNG